MKLVPAHHNDDATMFWAACQVCGRTFRATRLLADVAGPPWRYYCEPCGNARLNSKEGTDA